MHELSDSELLQRYALNGSEEAFAALVKRYVNLVYSAAARKTGNPQAAEEITQAVFIILARKADKLRPGTILTGWLYQTARLTSASFIKSEIRRIRREQEAYMHSPEPETDAWPEIAPLLDDAMGRLSASDRNALLLRYFEGKSFSEIAASVGASENAAKKRVIYALEKLRRYFSKHGVNSTTEIIAGALSANSIQAAPLALAKTTAALAITKGAAASGSTLTLIKGALKIMAWSNAKTAIVIGAGILLATGTATVTFNKLHASNSATADESWRTMNLNAKLLEQTPAQVHILPTKFSGDFGREVRLRGSGTGRKSAGVCVTVPQLIAAAYYGGGTPITPGAPSRTVYDLRQPTERYDYICTVTENSGAALQRELKEQVGLVGHRETRQVNVLLLRIHHANAPGLKPNPNEANSHGSETKDGVSFVAGRLSMFAGLIENILGVPVVDRTGATTAYDITLKFNGDSRDPKVFKQALLEQLGLELIPDRAPIEVLVVDKAK